MLASFLIPFHTWRIDNLTQTLRFLYLNHPDVVTESEVILLCQDQCGQIDTKFKNTILQNMRLDVMKKPFVLNHGVTLAESELLVILDSDRVLPRDYFRKVIEAFTPNTMVTTAKMHQLLHAVGDHDIIDGNYEFNVDYRDRGAKPYTRSVFSGNVVLSKTDYLRVGGMDEDYVGYGFEDSDMTATLLQDGVVPVFRDEIELHLHHQQWTYGKGDQKQLFLANGVRYCRKWNYPLPPQIEKEIKARMRNLI